MVCRAILKDPFYISILFAQPKNVLFNKVITNCILHFAGFVRIRVCMLYWQAVREAAARVGRGEVAAAEVTEETITRLLYTR